MGSARGVGFRGDGGSLFAGGAWGDVGLLGGGGVEMAARVLRGLRVDLGLAGACGGGIVALVAGGGDGGLVRCGLTGILLRYLGLGGLVVGCHEAP